MFQLSSPLFCRYVPEGWHHAVINVDDVVGISFQNTSCEGLATAVGANVLEFVGSPQPTTSYWY